MFLLGSVVGTRLSSRSEHLGSRLSQQRIHPQLAVWFAKSSDSALKWQSLEGADPPSGAIRGDGQGYHCAMEITSFDIAFRGGQGILTLTTDTGSWSLTNHWLNDRFPALVAAVEQVLAGVESVACRWPGPVNDGHIIDLVADAEGGVSLAVHAFAHEEGTSAAEIWSAARGALVLECHQSLASFVILFADAVRRVRAASVDASGLIVDYPRPFPAAAFERIETQAMRLGYQPMSMLDMGWRPE